MLLLLLPQGALRLAAASRSRSAAVYVAQTILALPYIVALTPAAIQGLPPGLLAQARALGAGRVQLSLLALREAKIGVLAAVIAALGAALSEVGAVDHRRRQHPGLRPDAGERARSTQFNDYANYPYALAIGIVLLALILVLIGALTVLQQRTGGIQLRFRTALTMRLLWEELTRGRAADRAREPVPAQHHLVHAPGRRDRDRDARP